MNRLKKRMLERIAADGPMPVSEFMTQCLLDPEDGYYTRRDPFGAAGDFVTAPEISQMFGELVAMFMAKAWIDLGSPTPLLFAEAGPGRGTLMNDMLRALKQHTGFLADANIHLIEASEKLIAAQRECLAHHGADIQWSNTIDELPDQPLFLVANEFLDALPVRQFVKTSSGWNERVIAASDDDLVWATGPATLQPAHLPDGAENQPQGTIFEIAPAREAFVASLAARLVRHGGLALFFDYGHGQSGFGDTLQAVRGHDFDAVLAAPGEADITSHVDFGALSQVARSQGAHVFDIMTQADFLLGLGLVERAGILGADKDEATRQSIRAAVQRLAGNGAGEMGDLFKVMGICSPQAKVEPFATSCSD